MVTSAHAQVIESSLKFGRQLDSDHIPLQHFFIVLEHVLRHGVRPKKVFRRISSTPCKLVLEKVPSEVS